jgi:hypothetical protein
MLQFAQSPSSLTKIGISKIRKVANEITVKCVRHRPHDAKNSEKVQKLTYPKVELTPLDLLPSHGSGRAMAVTAAVSFFAAQAQYVSSNYFVHLT